MNIGEKIKQRRMELGWSMRELSNRMGYLNHSTLSRIENGKVDLPQSRVVQFAEVLGTTVSYLMDWEKVQKNNSTITDAVVRMRSDEDFLSVVESLMSLDDEKLHSVKQMLSAFKK